MSQIVLKILNKEGKVLCTETGQNEVHLLYQEEYQEGDRIVVEAEEADTFYHIQLDEAGREAFVYLTGRIEYKIPDTEEKGKMSPKAFQGKKHLLSVKKAFPEEKMNYRNLAENIWDQEGEVNCYPHASSNVKLVSKPLYSAQSAIDGTTLTNRHGAWPYTAWSIARREDATLKIDFGRNVEVDRIAIYTRADFPHDSWWDKLTVSFSDGSKEQLDLVKSGQAQCFDICKRNIEWLEIGELIKADDPSPFPALTQLQVYGRG